MPVYQTALTRTRCEIKIILMYVLCCSNFAIKILMKKVAAKTLDQKQYCSNVTITILPVYWQDQACSLRDMMMCKK